MLALGIVQAMPGNAITSTSCKGGEYLTCSLGGCSPWEPNEEGGGSRRLANFRLAESEEGYTAGGYGEEFDDGYGRQLTGCDNGDSGYGYGCSDVSNGDSCSTNSDCVSGNCDIDNAQLRSQADPGLKS